MSNRNPFRVVIHTTEGVNPERIRLTEELPGRIEKMDLVYWEISGITTPPAIASHIQLDIGNAETQTIGYGINPSLIQIPLGGLGVPGVVWEGARLRIPIKPPFDRFSTFILSAYGEGVAPPLLAGVALQMTFWFDVWCKEDTGGHSWSVGQGSVFAFT